MSLDKNAIQNKMMTEAPKEKSGFHFASDGVHKAMYVWASTIQEAEKVYRASKELISQQSTVAPSTVINDGGDKEKN